MVKTVRFCAVCGNLNVKLVENLCLSCYFKQKMEHASLIAKISLCPSCFSYRVKGKWFKPAFPSINRVVEEVAKKSIRVALSPELNGTITFEAPPEAIRLKDGKNYVVLKTSYRDPSVTLEEYVTFVFNVKFESCPSCLKARKEPKEAILQFRGLDGKIPPQLYVKVLYIIERETRLKGVSHKIEEKKTGFDVKLSSQGLARSLAHKMKDLFNAEIKETFKLKSIRNGKKGILSISIRFPSNRCRIVNTL